jgi:hypothetical protein
MKANWSVVVIYEDPVVREAAVDFCDHLVERFWTKCGFDVSWWSFSLLSEPLSSREALEKAKAADFVVVALQPKGELDGHIQAWIETALRERGDREGALVGLPGVDTLAGDAALQKQMYLRNLAHRMGMDFLTRLPADLGYGIPDSWQMCTERADQVTTLLDEILRQRAKPELKL